MRALRSAVVSSALLFILGAGCLHPVSDAPTLQSAISDEFRASLLIVEFYPCAANGDEYMVLSNRGSEAVNLQDWTMTDGEGVISLLGGMLMPGRSLSISENESSYVSAYGEPPDVHVSAWSSGDGVDVSGRFRLADAGDVIELVSPDGVTSDVVAYGDVVPPAAGWLGCPIPCLRPGEVVRRLSWETAPDTDTSDDWTHFREFRYGYSDHAVISSLVPAGHVSSFASPDCSLDSVLGALTNAKTSIRLCAYELSSSHVCMCLSEMESRGVDVRVLVDALPVGGMSASELACISALSRNGVDVRVMGGALDDGVVRHVGAMHSKYIVVDNATLVALSENFVEEGVPADRLFGNRGWGVSVTDDALASFMASVFDDDSCDRRLDVWSWSDDPRCDLGAEIPDAVQDPHLNRMLCPSATTSEAEVSLYISPDASADEAFMAPLISEAADVAFEQFQAALAWDTRWSSEPCLNPVLEAIAEMLREGGRARGILDGSWYNIDGNNEAVSFLRASAAVSGSESSFGLLPDHSPIVTMHNKGVVLDGSSIVSSNNWVYPSFAKNRELAVVVRSMEVSSYFLGAFELDWVPDTRPPVADAGPDIGLAAPGEVVLDASSSWDDRAVADIYWDFDCDGQADASGVQAVFFADGVGAFNVRVEVEDAWGNTATDSVTVTVGPSAAPGGQEAPVALNVPWMLPAAASALIAAFVAARKLNLLRPSTRGKG